MGKRILYIAACVLVAHVIASYIWVWVAVMRVDELNGRFGGTKYTIPTGLRVQAPVRIFSVMGWIREKKIDSGKGVAALWAAYLGPLLLIAGAAASAPWWLFVEDQASRRMYGGKPK